MTTDFHPLADHQGGAICSVDGIPNDTVTANYLVHTRNDDRHFDELPEGDREVVLSWLWWNIYPAKKRLQGHTTYGMKHILQQRTHIYLSNNQMKEAMLRLGFFPCVVDAYNWEFNIRQSSPIFIVQRDGENGLPLIGHKWKQNEG